jgi:hypothetical protein
MNIPSRSLVSLINICCAVMTLSSVYAQDSFVLSDYVVSSVGDKYQYKNNAPDGLSPIVVGVSEEVYFRDIMTHKRYENNGDYRLQRIDDKGLTIYHLYFVGDREIRYASPILQMPGILEISRRHKSQSAYTYLESGVEKDRGVQVYEIETIGLQDVRVGSRNIKDCLVIVTTALRTNGRGAQKGYKLREWYAKGEGPVKVLGELYWNDTDGSRSRTFQIDAELESSTVNHKDFEY